MRCFALHPPAALLHESQTWTSSAARHPVHSGVGRAPAHCALSDYELPKMVPVCVPTHPPRSTLSSPQEMLPDDPVDMDEEIITGG